MTGIFYLPVFALPGLQKDSSQVDIRKIPADNLATYKQDKNFQYNQQVTEGMSLWERFWHWFWEKVNELMQQKGVEMVLKIAMYVVPALIFIFAILRFIGMEKVMLWISGNKNSNPEFSISADNIYGIDFSQAIEEAEAKQRYRDATRLYYLKTLRSLSDQGRIQWAKSKTNIDFANDLAGSGLAKGFADITRIYEYAWYGEFAVSGPEYSYVKDHFSQFEKQIGL